MEPSILEKQRRRLSSRFPVLGGWFRRRAVQFLVADGSPQAVHLLIGAVANDPESKSAAAAVDALLQLADNKNQEAREALCRLVIRYDLVDVRIPVVEAGHLPGHELQRAMFFFMTEQWDRYEALDFDQRLLRLAYETGDEVLRGRIARQARRAGRLEWVDVVAGGRQGRRLAAMSDREWNAAITVLEEHQRWPEVWRLAQEAPPRWGAVLMRRLDHTGWTPPENEREDFDELARLADIWRERDVPPVLHGRGVLRAHGDAVRCLAIHPDGDLLASGSDDRTIRLWRLPDGKPLRTLEAHTGSVTCLAIAPDGRRLISAGRDGDIRLWSLPDGRFVKRLHGHRQAITCMALSRNGRLLASGSIDRTVRLWSLPRGNKLARLAKHDLAVSCLEISRDGSLLISGSPDCTVCVWSLPKGNLLKRLSGHRSEESDSIVAVALRPDGKMLATSGTDQRMTWWNLPGGGQLQSVENFVGTYSALRFSPDGRLLATGGGDHSVRFWEVAGGREFAPLNGHTSEVTSLLFRPDGRVLYSASGGGMCQDRGICVWDVEEKQMLQWLYGHARYITCLALTPDGSLLASGSADGTVRLWGAELDRLSRLPVRQATLQDLEWVQARCNDEIPDEERAILEFMVLLFRRARRADIVVEEAPARKIEIGAFDIEIEG